MATEEFCLVCADQLEFTAIGECGHKEVCSKCCARWRFVLKDTRCMVCKQEQQQVFFTRYMGDFTQRLTPEHFASLPDRAKRGELYSLPDIGGYFDDQQHYQTIKGLVGYIHPQIVEKCKENGREPPNFRSIGEMKKFVDNNFKLHFCDICIQGRKVFLCEQRLYTKSELDKHMKTGDETGDLADTSFKGHPLCKFCRRRFYDSNDLYRHMEQDHEHCFLCRRENPGQYVYYRHYAELEEHFQKAHFCCMHQSCQEKKFVVFSSEHELKRHIATTHGDELKMSRAARREAMTIPLNLQYSTDASASSSNAAAPAIDSRPGVVIGGGYNVGSRHGRGGANNVQGGGMRHSQSTGEMQAALAASMQEQDAARARAAARQGRRRAEPEPPAASTQATFDADTSISSVTFSAQDFPTVPGSAGGLPVTGIWGGGVPGMSTGPLNEESFPALPTMSKAAQKRLRERQASLAEQLRAANMPVRVVNRASGGSSGTRAGTSNQQASGSGSTSNAVGSAGPSRTQSGEATRTSSGSFHMSQSAGDLQSQSALRFPSPMTSTHAPSGTSLASAVARGNGAPLSPLRSSQAAAAPAVGSEMDFPSLPGAPSGPVTCAAPPPAPTPSRYTTTMQFFRGAVPAGPSAISAATASNNQPPNLQQEDFPGLPTSSKASNKQKGKLNKPAKNNAAAANTVPAASVPATPDSPSQQNGITEGVGVPGSSSKTLQQANKELITKIQSQLGDDAQFAKFKSESAQFQRGKLSSDEYHSLIRQLGLLALVPDLARLCPSAERREALLEAHRQFIQSPEAQDPASAGPGWVPPEAAMAMLQSAQQHASWSCPRCTLTNAPGVLACEACGATAPGLSQPVDAFPSLTSTYGISNSRNSNTATGSASSSGAGSSKNATQAAAAPQDDASSSSGKKKGGKNAGTKITIGLGAGTGSRAAAQPTEKPVVNAWGSSQAAPSGTWAPSKGGGSKIARMHHALNDGWGDK